MLQLSIYKGMVGRVALIGALLVGAVAVFLMTGGSGEGQARCDQNYCIEYPEHGSGAVIVLTALDPEEKDVTWALDDNNTNYPDNEAFRIEEGRLTFSIGANSEPPDFEMPMDGTQNDPSRDNVYLVAIEATDIKVGGTVRLATVRDDPVTRTLKVTVTNVDEAGVVKIPTLQPQERIPISVTLTDPDGKPSGTFTTDLTTSTDGAETAWQWSRSTRATGRWTDIEDDPTTTANESTTAKTAMYTPTRADVGMYLRATATYIDGHSAPGDPKKTAHAVSANPVQLDPRNNAPQFLDENGNDITSTTRSVAENSEAGTPVGAPVTATDRGFDGRQETLTYVLTGAGVRDFDIDSGTGQIRVRGALDYEVSGRRTHTVSVRATDPSGLSDNITVNIEVTDVDEAPTIRAGNVTVDYNEDRPAGEEVAAFTADDPDGDDPASLKWSLSGRDAARFAIGNYGDDRGRLTFRDTPDYEAPTDSDRDNVYEVTVEVADRGGSKATRDVTVSVENVEEDGLLTVSSLRPQVGVRITPTLRDPDTPISNLIWTWEINGNVESRANSYTPRPADEDRSLVVSVTYTDGTGERRTLSLPSLSFVEGRDLGGNRSPRFSTSILAQLTVSENRPKGEPVGGPVTADDPDGDDLTYSISGDDAIFSINQTTGQIETRTSLDRERKSSYRVTVTAEDPSGARDTHSLMIAVDDEDEPPAITSGDSYIYYAENDRDNVAAYRAEDPEGRSIIWTLTGDDVEDFTFDRGILEFMSPPNYELEGEYRVTVNASDGHADNVDSEEVTIKIINVDEKGVVTLTNEPKAGEDLTALLEDPDGSESIVAWQWAKSPSRTGRFTDIQGATSATYEPVDSDAGNYLRATVTYTDGQGEGKSKSAFVVSTNRTLWRVSGPPKFLGPDGNDLTDTTRKVNENARAGTNVGASVAATDIGSRGIPENLSYALGTTGDNLLFDIVRSTGQIKVKRDTTLDYEDINNTDHEFAVTVTATDGSGGTDTIAVTIEVVDVDEKPTLELGDTVGVGDNDDFSTGFTHAEPVAAGDSESNTETVSLSITFVGDDPETENDGNGNNNTTLNWTLAGTDADDFNLADGVLTFKNGGPDFENSTARRPNMYEVIVQANDDAGNTASQSVRITVTDVDEAGSVVTLLMHPQPQMGVTLRASLDEPDRVVRSPSWKWYRALSNPDAALPENICADSPDDTNCLIRGATGTSYKPREYTANNTDVGRALTVVASYTDAHGVKSELFTTATVEAVDLDNADPVFSDDSATREVPEDKTPPEVGAIFTATDDDGDTLDYSLSGRDARYFEIGRGTGQITVKADTELDYESNKKTYNVTVRATDPSGDYDTIAVTIMVTDVDEAPELTRRGLVAVGRGSISYPENGRNTVAEYSAIGPNAGSVSWRLGGPDAGDFSINSRGALTFRSTPDFEKPADADRDNTYELTVRASSRGESDEFGVMVYVDNVDEAGEVRLTPTRGIIGTRITAEVTDPDGAVTGVFWEWARSETGLAGWTPIPGTNSDSYVLESEDKGYYVQATAYYSDPQGGGKSASARTTAVVLADDDGRVTLSPATAQVGTTLTARLTDPDGNVRNVSWQWYRSESSSSGWSEIPGATSSTYTTVALDLANYLRAEASYDDGDGPDKVADAVTSAAVVEDDDGTVALSTTTPSVGETVTATLTDPDGGVTRASWQWASSSTGTSGWNDIDGATSRTYTVAAGVLNRYLRATVVYDDAAGAGKSAEAVTTAAVAEDDDGSVTLSPASPSDGDRVTATLSDPDGGVTGTAWQWAWSSNGTSNWTDIPGATSATYTPVTADVGSYLRATVTYTDAVGPGKSAEAVTAVAVTADDDGSVTLSNTTPTDGETVTATLSDPDGRVSGATWQWAISRDRTTWTVILNATSSSYTATTTNVGSYLRASVSYTDAVGPGKSASAVTAAAVAPDDDGTVTLSTRAPEVGSAITASLSDPDGGVTGETWQWAKSSNGATGWTDIQGATSASYTPGRSDTGVFLRATVSYNDAVGPGKSAQAATSSGVVQAALLSEYDANRDGRIERSEAIQAVSDFFNGEISKGDVLDVLVLYFSS